MDPRINHVSFRALSIGGLPRNGVHSGEECFNRVLGAALGQGNVGAIHVSAHAEKRLQERHLSLDGNLGETLANAIEELRAKGARDSLVVTPEAAFVVHVPTRTLVTAMDRSEMRDRIVTNIDSVSVKN